LTSEEIKELAKTFGAQVCGIASVESFSAAPEGFHPRDILNTAKSVIIIGKEFNKGVFNASTNVPYTLVRNTLIQLVEAIDYQLTIALEEKGLALEEKGFASVPIPTSEPYEFWDDESRKGKGIMSLKHAAVLTGIGFMGKNTLLINDKYGNRLWLGGVITERVLKPDAINEKSCPENCRLCLEACPQEALDGLTISQKKCREISALGTAGGGWILTCNKCRKACPYSKT